MSNLVREKLEDYFASMNPTSSRMMADIMTHRKENSSNWDALPHEEQSEIIWKSIVKPEAVKKYENLPVENIENESFPVLRLKPGEKIVVDEDTTAARPFGCTWRDEHSAPFRWETQSQLDLHLDGEDSDTDKIRTLEKPPPPPTPAKQTDSPKPEPKKDDDVKRSNPVKRPEVPPPPVPPHCQSPVVPSHSESPSKSPQPGAQSSPNDTPIYAKVVKRRSAAKTLVLGEIRSHRKSQEEVKPAVPPRRSLELKGDFNASKYKTLPIDFDDIPKTGFDFLDNW